MGKRIGEPNPDGYGPWVGVPRERQDVCAVEGCVQRGQAWPCLADGSSHHHGCIHYDRLKDQGDLKFREGHWCLLCEEHYRLLERLNGMNRWWERTSE